MSVTVTVVETLTVFVNASPADNGGVSGAYDVSDFIRLGDMWLTAVSVMITIALVFGGIGVFFFARDYRTFKKQLREDAKSVIREVTEGRQEQLNQLIE